jgi:hypothetical protein
MADTKDSSVEFLLSLGTDQAEHAGDTTFMQHLTETRDLLRKWGCAPFVCEVGLLHSIYGTEAFQPPESLPVSERARVQAVAGAECERLCFINCVMVRESFDEAVATLCKDGVRSCLERGTTELPAEPEFEIAARPGDPSDAVTWDPHTGARYANLPEKFVLSRRELVDLGAMLLADWLQQVPHHEASMTDDKPLHMESHTIGGVKGNFVVAKGGWWSLRRETWDSLALICGGEANADYHRVFGALDAVAQAPCEWRPLGQGELMARSVMREHGSKAGSRLAPGTMVMAAGPKL